MLDDWACDSWAQKRAPGAFLACLLVSYWTLLVSTASTWYGLALPYPLCLRLSDIASIKNAANHARWSPRLAGWCGCRPAAHSTRARGGAAGPYECEPSAENDQRNRRSDGDTILMLARLTATRAPPRTAEIVQPPRHRADASVWRRSTHTQASSPGRSRSERTAWVVISDPNRGSWTATRNSV
jgi:hypothetical protein